MPDNPQSLAGIITKHSSKSVAQTVDRLTRVIADRGFTLFRVIDHSGTAEQVGVQMPDSKLVMFGKPTVGAAVMFFLAFLLKKNEPGGGGDEPAAG